MAKEKKNKDLEKFVKQQGKAIGNKIKEKMKEQNITPKELARRIAIANDDAKVEKELKQIGLSAKYNREKKNMTVQELADKSGLSPDTINRFENGDPETTFDAMVLISYSLGISLIELISNKDIKKS